MVNLVKLPQAVYKIWCQQSFNLSSHTQAHMDSEKRDTILAVVKALKCIYTVRQKTAPFYFCGNFVRSFYIRILIGSHIP